MFRPYYRGKIPDLCSRKLQITICLVMHLEEDIKYLNAVYMSLPDYSEYRVYRINY